MLIFCHDDPSCNNCMALASIGWLCIHVCCHYNCCYLLNSQFSEKQFSDLFSMRLSPFFGIIIYMVFEFLPCSFFLKTNTIIYVLTSSGHQNFYWVQNNIQLQLTCGHWGVSWLNCCLRSHCSMAKLNLINLTR